MAIESGTATGIIDLYRKLRNFVLATAGWSAVLGGAKHTDTEGFRGLVSPNQAVWNLFDGTASTYVQLNTNEEVEMEFFDPVEIGRVKITVPDLSGGGPIDSSPDTIRFETSSDGVFWTLAQEWSAEPQWSDLESRTYVFGTPVTTRWFRILVPVSGAGSFTYLAQVQLFNAAGVGHYVNLGDYNARFCVQSPFEPTPGGAKAHLLCQLYMDDSAPRYNLGFGAAADMSDDSDPILNLTRLKLHNASSLTFSLFRDTPMPYWFYGTDRFIYGFVQVGNTYRQFGVGYLLAYATPDQYPFPVFVGAECSDRSFNWEVDANGDVKGFTNPGNGALHLFTPAQVWKTLQNYGNSGGQDELNPTIEALWPGCVSEFNLLRNAPGTNDTNGNHVLFPLIARSSAGEIYGELPDIYAVPSLSLTSVDTVTIQAQAYRVFQNLWRNAPHDFCAVKEA